MASAGVALACAPKQAAAPSAAPPVAPDHAEHALVCTYTYAGEPKRLDVLATRDAYGVKGTDVYGRFDFKVVYVDAPADVAGIRVYTYRLGGDGPVLIHQAKYATSARNHGRYGFTGQHFVYDPDGRELSYHCAWQVE